MNKYDQVMEALDRVLGDTISGAQLRDATRAVMRSTTHPGMPLLMVYPRPHNYGDEVVFQADAWMGDQWDYHAIAKTPEEAVFELGRYWLARAETGKAAE